MMRTLVLGGTGFISRHLVYELLRRGHQVSVLNRGQTPAELLPDVERLYADRTDPEAVKRALGSREFDAAFDLSAYTTQTLAPAVEALEGRVGRYVFCSTVGVYTPSETFPIRESQPLARDSLESLAKSAQYALNKVACENYLAERWRTRAFPLTILRPCIVYGPHNIISYWELSFFARLRRRRPILVPSDGSKVMHCVFVDDVAAAFASVPESGSSLGQAYSVAGPEANTFIGYASILGRIVGVEPELVFVPPDMMDDAETPSSFSGFPWRRSVIFSIEKAQAHLGFRPRPLSVGLAETYRWYLAEGLDDRPWDFSEEDSLLKRLRV